MPGQFCPRCGATSALYRGFCVPCFLLTHPIKIQKIEIGRCRACGSLRDKKEWVNPEDLNRIILGKIRVDLAEPKLELEKFGKKHVLKISGFLGSSQIEQEAEPAISFFDALCDKCRCVAGKYHEAEIQVRGDAGALVTFIKKASRKLGATFWFEKTKDGTDFFFPYKKQGDAVLSKAAARFKITPTRSSRFCGYTKQGKKKVKFTYCLRI